MGTLTELLEQAKNEARAALPKRIELLRKYDLSPPVEAAGEGETAQPVVPICGTYQ